MSEPRIALRRDTLKHAPPFIRPLIAGAASFMTGHAAKPGWVQLKPSSGSREPKSTQLEGQPLAVHRNTDRTEL